MFVIIIETTGGITLATKVYDTLEIELQDGTEVMLRPLNIKQLRKFMDVVAKLSDAGEMDNLDLLLDACAIALSKKLPDLVADRDRLEEALDIPTIWKILEISGGIKMNDPNLLTETALAGLN